MCVVLIIVYNFLVKLFQDISEFKKSIIFAGQISKL